MNAILAERSTDGLIADNPTDELLQFEVEPPVTEVPEPVEPHDALENRGVLDGLKIIGLG